MSFFCQVVFPQQKDYAYPKRVKMYKLKKTPTEGNLPDFKCIKFNRITSKLSKEEIKMPTYFLKEKYFLILFPTIIYIWINVLYKK